MNESECILFPYLELFSILKIHFYSLVLAHIFYLLVLDIEIKIRLIFFRPNNSILEIILLTIRLIRYLITLILMVLI